MTLPDFRTLGGETFPLRWQRFKSAAEVKCEVPKLEYKNLGGILRKKTIQLLYSGDDGNDISLEESLNIYRERPMGLDKRELVVLSEGSRRSAVESDRPWAAENFPEINDKCISILNDHNFPVVDCLNSKFIVTFWHNSEPYWAISSENVGYLIHQGQVIPWGSEPFPECLFRSDRRDAKGIALSIEPLIEEYWPRHSAFRWALQVWPAILQRRVFERRAEAANIKKFELEAIWNSAFELGSFLKEDFYKRNFDQEVFRRQEIKIKNAKIAKCGREKATKAAHDWYRAFGDYMSPLIKSEVARLGRGISRSDAALLCHNAWPDGGFEGMMVPPALSTVEEALSWLEGTGWKPRGEPPKGRRPSNKK